MPGVKRPSSLRSSAIACDPRSTRSVTGSATDSPSGALYWFGGMLPSCALATTRRTWNDRRAQAWSAAPSLVQATLGRFEHQVQPLQIVRMIAVHPIRQPASPDREGVVDVVAPVFDDDLASSVLDARKDAIGEGRPTQPFLQRQRAILAEPGQPAFDRRVGGRSGHRTRGEILFVPVKDERGGEGQRDGQLLGGRQNGRNHGLGGQRLRPQAGSQRRDHQRYGRPPAAAPKAERVNQRSSPSVSDSVSRAYYTTARLTGRPRKRKRAG